MHTIVHVILHVNTFGKCQQGTWPCLCRSTDIVSAAPTVSMVSGVLLFALQCTKVTHSIKTGRIRGFRAIVAVGNGNGLVGTCVCARLFVALLCLYMYSQTLLGQTCVKPGTHTDF